MANFRYKINIKDIQDRYKFKVFMRSGANIPKSIADDILSIKSDIETLKLHINHIDTQLAEMEQNNKDLKEKIDKITKKTYKYIEVPTISNLVGTGYVDNNYSINENMTYIFRHKVKCIQGDKISLRTNTNLNFFAIIYYTKNNDIIYGEKSSSTTEIQNFVAPENTDYAIIVSYFKESFVEYSSLKIMRKIQNIEGE